ncbi:PEGA domain-containing protein [Polyangium jinanense]|uniref:PEGA domain-containing protein n=1 Tax=Polyangium jinanense TaxID=2829994 RepID=UPI002341A1E2|nr:PEGA domain-containing protein [Polyangium jinanense]MDC3956935.1 PEGA domain-containing protein [Polyangium jinanense]
MNESRAEAARVGEASTRRADVREASRRRAGRAWLAGLVAAHLLVSGAAFGQGKAPGAAAAAGSAQVTEAERHFAEGVKFAQAKQWAKAREEFAKAYELSQDPRYLAALIRAEEELGRYRDVAERLTIFLRDGKNIDQATRQEAEKKLDEARKKLGTVTVVVGAEGAEVLLDGQKLGTSPLAKPVFVDPGKHTFEAQKAGYEPAKQELVVEAGSAPEVRLALTAAGGSANSGSGAGNGFVGVPGEKVPADTSPKWRTYAAIGGLGLAVVGLGVGIGMTVAASSKYGELEDEFGKLRSDPARNLDTFGELVAEHRTLKGGMIAGYVVGGAALVGTAAFWFLTKPKPKPEAKKVMLAPAVGGGHAGAILVGEF